MVGGCPSSWSTLVKENTRALVCTKVNIIKDFHIRKTMPEVQSLLLGLKLKRAEPVEYRKFLGQYVSAHYGEKVWLTFDS
jgi:hypothetical protein